MTGRGLIRDVGLAVPVSGRDTNGVAICNPVRSFDIPARLQAKTARFIEALDKATVDEIMARVVGTIDPASDDS
ncbi:hypothetical protein [Neorhizobium alkalisoli]|uniref:hypothetical protein n=1 Tax=Neorhizobium alkalisoli TaxID=528178 RepID=UPI001AED3B4C|nr:hypothetical protein [Neorhizobium alkalisoli]